MTTKLTLTVDEDVIQAAKKYAVKKGTSVSKLVENYLKVTTKNTTYDGAKISPVVKKMLGAAKLSKGSYKDILTRELRKKYS